MAGLTDKEIIQSLELRIVAFEKAHKDLDEDILGLLQAVQVGQISCRFAATVIQNYVKNKELKAADEGYKTGYSRWCLREPKVNEFDD